MLSHVTGWYQGRDSPQVKWGWQEVWVAAKRPRKECPGSLEFPSPVGAVEFEKIWETEALGEGLLKWRDAGQVKVPMYWATSHLRVNTTCAEAALGGSRRGEGGVGGGAGEGV